MELKEFLNPEINKDSKILVLCSHGKTRSKAVKKILEEEGYTNVSALGIKDKNTPVDMETEAQNADLLIFTQTDVLTDFVHKYPKMNDKKSFNLNISEKDHSLLYQDINNKIAIKNISMKLGDLGFIQ